VPIVLEIDITHMPLDRFFWPTLIEGQIIECNHRADSGRSGALIPFEVGQRSAAMWGSIPPGSGTLLKV
jgi:hypothetical protein